MAFKMKGFPFAGKSPTKQKISGSAPTDPKKKIEGEAPTDPKKKIKGKAPVDPGKPVDPGSLYGKLTAKEKKAFNALTSKQKANVMENKTLSQIRQAISGYEPEYEGGD
jgi:hypothetical protein